MADFLEEQVKRALADFDGIEAALVQNGIAVPAGTDTSEYAALINKLGVNMKGKVDVYQGKDNADKLLSVGKDGYVTLIAPNWMATSEEHISTTVVIPEQTASTTWSNLQYNLQPGIVYDVYINGTVYPCTAISAGSSVVLGNHSLMSSSSTLPNNNEPFCIYWAGGTAQMGMFFKDSERLSSPITIKVMEHSEIIYNKLPEEFLPESVDSVIIRSSTEGSTKKFKISVDDTGTITATEVA